MIMLCASLPFVAALVAAILTYYVAPEWTPVTALSALVATICVMRLVRARI